MATRKPRRKSAKDNVKAGTSRIEAQARRRLFVRAYLANGRNALQAAISAGFSEKGAGQTGYQLLKEPQVVAMLEEATREYEKIAGLDQTRTLQEIARIAYFDPRRTFHDDGTPKHLLEMDDDTAAAIASEKTLQVAGAVTSVERRFHDKNAALDKAAKFHGIYEKDNKQREPVKVIVELVG